MTARRMFAAFLLGAMTLSAVAVSAQEKKAAPAKKAAAPAMDEKAMMDMMQKIASPGPGHKKLDVLVGTWHSKISMFMDPSKPPVVSDGPTVFKWVLGGRYLEQTADSTFMGQPFSGLGYTAYDNYKKKYVSTWMDTMGTMIMMASGNFDAAGKVLTTTGRMDDPTTGKSTPFREKMTVVSNDEIRFEMFTPGPDGKEIRNMEIRYTRKK
jgi:hypothetical protein